MLNKQAVSLAKAKDLAIFQIQNSLKRRFRYDHSNFCLVSGDSRMI